MFLFLAFALVCFFSCKKDEAALTKNSHKNVFSFILTEPSLNLDISCGRQLSYPGRISGLVCPATYGKTYISDFQFKSSLSTGAVIEPADSSWVDFSNPVQFTVKAEDGSDTTFWVTVGTVEGFWLKDGVVVDTMKFELDWDMDWTFRKSELSANAFEFKIGKPCRDIIGGVIQNWDYQDFTVLPKTIPFAPQVQSRITGCAFNGSSEYCTDCSLTITELDLERGVFSGTWNLSFNGDVVNGSIGSFKNAPLYGKY